MDSIKRGDIYDLAGRKIVVLDIEKVPIRRTKGKTAYRYWVVFSDKFINIDNQLVDEFQRIIRQCNGRYIGNSEKHADMVDDCIKAIGRKPYEGD